MPVCLCAEMYGTESECGAALSQYLAGSGKKREQLWVTSKVMKSLPDAAQVRLNLSWLNTHTHAGTCYHILQVPDLNLQAPGQNLCSDADWQAATW